MKHYFLKYKFFAQNPLPAVPSVMVTPNDWKCWLNTPRFRFVCLNDYFYIIFVEMQSISLSSIEIFLHYFSFFISDLLWNNR